MEYRAKDVLREHVSIENKRHGSELQGGSATFRMAQKQHSSENIQHMRELKGVASGRQGQSYGIVTITLQKGATDPRTGITYNEHS